jgi:sugar lactone lactonase YvrE
MLSSGMRIVSAEPLHNTPDLLGEGPVWHQGAFWWLDIEAKLFQRLDPSGTHQQWNLPERAGTAIPAADGTWILGLETRLARLHPDNGRIDTLAPLGKPPGAYRFNDGKADPRGRVLIGTMSLSAPVPTAAFYRYDGGSTLTQLFDGVGTSNGLDWSADGRTLYYIDSKTGRIDAFDYDCATGTPANRRIIVAAAPQGRPDGLCLDADGNIWAGHWGGWAVRCYSGSTGDLLAEIPIPCANATSCCFGGTNLDQLFITTASKGLTPQELEIQHGAGKVFVARPGVQGRPPHMAAPPKS